MFASGDARATALGIGAFALGALYVPGIFGAADTPRWALLAIGVPFLAMTIDHHRPVFIHLVGGAFLAWCAISLMWSENLHDGLNAMFKLALLAGLFCAGYQLMSMRAVWLGFGLGIAVSSAVAVWQWATLERAQVVGLFDNPNQMGEPAALALIAAVLYRMHWLAILILPAVLLSQSRGAMLGLLAAAVVMLWRRFPFLVIGGCALVVIVGMLFALNASALHRLEIWHDASNQLTWLGWGLGSVWTVFPGGADMFDVTNERPEHLHNDLLEVIYETGVIGGALAVAFAFTVLHRAELSAEYAVVIAFLVIGCFGFPLHMPMAGAMAALAAGHLAGKRDALCDAVHDGGMASRAGPESGISGSREQSSASCVALIPAQSSFPRWSRIDGASHRAIPSA